jgi:hypothetical protein
MKASVHGATVPRAVLTSGLKPARAGGLFHPASSSPERMTSVSSTCGEYLQRPSSKWISRHGLLKICQPRYNRDGWRNEP